MTPLTLITYLTRDMKLMPVGPLSLATLARQKGVEVAVVNLPAPHEEDALAEELAGQQVVGMSTLCATFHRSLRLAAKIKSINPRVTLCMGGPQASAVAVPLLQRHAYIDLVFRGEAEEGWKAFLQGDSLHQIPGLVYRAEGTVVENPSAPLLMDLDLLPMPAFDLYPLFNCSVPLESGRGCPFACTYCSTNLYFSRRFRVKSPRRILEEMDQLHALYGVRAFDLIEDTFTTNRRKILDFCTAIQTHSQRYTWNISARADQVDEDLLQRLRSAGCRGIYFGIETGSQRMQKVVRKNLRVTRVMENLLLAQKSGLATTASFIIGFPGETASDLRETLHAFGRLAEKRGLVMQMHILSPLAGSKLVASGEKLAYDGMPTDFNTTEELLGPEDWESFREDAELFPHMHYFRETEVPRARYLFVAYVMRLCDLYFPNFSRAVFQWRLDGWCDYLLNGPVPEEMVNDPAFPLPVELWIERGYTLFVAFAQGAELPGLVEILAYDRAFSRVSYLAGEPSVVLTLPRAIAGRMPGRYLPDVLSSWHDLASYVLGKDDNGRLELSLLLTGAEIEVRLQEICGRCGECCLDDDGLMCGIEEWGKIANFLENQHRLVPRITPTAWQGLLLEIGVRYLAHSVEDELTMHDTLEAARAAVGREGFVRHACAHLEVREGLFYCAIQEVKPAECLAFPFRPMGDGGQEWHMEAMQSKRCALSRVLEIEPTFRRHYLEWAKSRMGPHSGAVALGRLNAAEEEEQNRWA
ncbi:MAG: B12-binding domain-containing radical SAM protein [Magnetococcales bacterium]|nr:B12-binding domain-containing radical SAM protein [Magnetococcales bacterium]